MNNAPQQIQQSLNNNNGVPQKPGTGQMINSQPDQQPQRLNNNRPKKTANPNQQIQMDSIPAKPQ